MKRDWNDFKSLHGGTEGARAAFETACETIFRKHYADEHVSQVSVSQGDGGIDIFVGEFGEDPITVIQCKFFLDSFADSQKSQIRESFKTAFNSEAYDLKQWILCVPRVIDIDENSWWFKWKHKTIGEHSMPSSFIELRNGNELIDLAKRLGLYDQIFEIEDSLRLAEIHEAVVSQAYRAYREPAAPAVASNVRVGEFKTLVRERTRNFVGREFIFRAIEGLIDNPEFRSGYILIHGEPGIGKTSLVAELVRQHGYVHHFNIAAQNIRSTGQFLSNVCAQIILSCGLRYSKLPPELGDDSGFFSKLLAEAAEGPEGKPLVILVDALDESEGAGAMGANRLLLPQILPDGVFIIVTTREVSDSELLVDSQRNIYIHDNDPQNVADVSKFIARYLAAHEKVMGAKLDSWDIGHAEFVKILAGKSEGNFMYVVHVLDDLCSGILKPDTMADFREIPSGLRGYYRHHWRLMKSVDENLFERIHRPVVCSLAAAYEAVTVEQLLPWASQISGSSLASPQIRQVITEWRQFLNGEVTCDGQHAYRIYHQSFRDFLGDEVGLEEFHSNIARNALAKLSDDPLTGDRAGSDHS